MLQKLAGWLEYYAEAMELNIWTSCEVTKAALNDNHTWAVTVQFSDGKEHSFKNIKHLVFATGLNGNQPNMPSYPGTVSRFHLTSGAKEVWWKIGDRVAALSSFSIQSAFHSSLCGSC